MYRVSTLFLVVALATSTASAQSAFLAWSEEPSGRLSSVLIDRSGRELARRQATLLVAYGELWEIELRQGTNMQGCDETSMAPYPAAYSFLERVGGARAIIPLGHACLAGETFVDVARGLRPVGLAGPLIFTADSLLQLPEERTTFRSFVDSQGEHNGAEPQNHYAGILLTALRQALGNTHPIETGRPLLVPIADTTGARWVFEDRAENDASIQASFTADQLREALSAVPPVFASSPYSSWRSEWAELCDVLVNGIARLDGADVRAYLAAHPTERIRGGVEVSSAISNVIRARGLGPRDARDAPRRPRHGSTPNR